MLHFNQQRDSFSKRAELFLRRALRRAVFSTKNSALIRTPLLSFDFPAQPSILILRQDKIGDALISTPIFRILRDHFPKAHIDILLGSANIGIKPALDYLNTVWLYTKKPTEVFRLLAKLRARRYDVVIDLQDKPSTTSALLVLLIRSRYSVGFDHADSEIFTHRVPALPRDTSHIVERTAQILLPFGIHPTPENLTLFFPISVEAQSIAQEKIGIKPHSDKTPVLCGINISGSGENKYWGTENFIRLVQALTVTFPDVEFLLFGLPSYSDRLSKISQETSVRIAPAATNFMEFAAFLHECDVIFTPDTSAVHLAAAWQKPCVALFLWQDRTVLPWFPYQSPHRSLTTSAENMSEIPVDDALSAMIEMIQLRLLS